MWFLFDKYSIIYYTDFCTISDIWRCAMEKTYTGEIRRINFLFSEMESLYHLADLRLGISDSASLVLYALYDAGGQCPLADIYKNSGISKQTINSAIRGPGKGGPALPGAISRPGKKSGFDGQGKPIRPADRRPDPTGGAGCLCLLDGGGGPHPHTTTGEIHRMLSPGNRKAMIRRPEPLPIQEKL